jgi:hypothetical protein
MKRGLFLNFSYVCPEPVLVKRSFFQYINGSKRVAFLQVGSGTFSYVYPPNTKRELHLNNGFFFEGRLRKHARTFVAMPNCAKIAIILPRQARDKHRES